MKKWSGKERHTKKKRGKLNCINTEASQGRYACMAFSMVGQREA